MAHCGRIRFIGNSGVLAIARTGLFYDLLLLTRAVFLFLKESPITRGYELFDKVMQIPPRLYGGCKTLSGTPFIVAESNRARTESEEGGSAESKTAPYRRTEPLYPGVTSRAIHLYVFICTADVHTAVELKHQCP